MEIKDLVTLNEGVTINVCKAMINDVVDTQGRITNDSDQEEPNEEALSEHERRHLSQCEIALVEHCTIFYVIINCKS